VAIWLTRLRLDRHSSFSRVLLHRTRRFVPSGRVGSQRHVASAHTSCQRGSKHSSANNSDQQQSTAKYTIQHLSAHPTCSLFVRRRRAPVNRGRHDRKHGRGVHYYSANHKRQHQLPRSTQSTPCIKYRPTHKMLTTVTPAYPHNTSHYQLLCFDTTVSSAGWTYSITDQQLPVSLCLCLIGGQKAFITATRRDL